MHQISNDHMIITTCVNCNKIFHLYDCLLIFFLSCADVPSVTKHSIAVPCMIFMFCHMFQKKSSLLYAVSVPADFTVKPCCANMREFISPERRDSSIHVTFVLRSKCLSLVLQTFLVALC